MLSIALVETNQINGMELSTEKAKSYPKKTQTEDANDEDKKPKNKCKGQRSPESKNITGMCLPLNTPGLENPFFLSVISHNTPPAQSN